MTPELAIDADDLASIAIRLPRWMLEDLRKDAEGQGTTVSEHIRRCVSLWKHLYGEDPRTRVVATRSDGRAVRVRLENPS